MVYGEYNCILMIETVSDHGCSPYITMYIPKRLAMINVVNLFGEYQYCSQNGKTSWKIGNPNKKCFPYHCVCVLHNIVKYMHAAMHRYMRKIVNAFVAQHSEQNTEHFFLLFYVYVLNVHMRVKHFRFRFIALRFP